MENTEQAKQESTSKKDVDLNMEADGDEQGGQVLTTELMDKLIKDDDAWNKWFQSKTDKRVTSAIETYRSKTVPGLLQERENKIREELLPTETPEQKILTQMIKEREQEKKEKRMTELENFAIKKANALGVSEVGDQISYFIGADEDEIQKRLSWLVQRDKDQYELGRGSFLKENVNTPEVGDDDEKPMFKTLKSYQEYLQRTKKPYDRKIYERITAYNNRRK
jgi:hypothetical protein